MKLFIALAFILISSIATGAQAQDAGAPAVEQTAEQAAAQTPPAAVIPPANPEPLGDYTKYYGRGQAPVMLNGLQMALSYFLYSPVQPWPADAKFPLVLALHGAQGVAEAGRFLIAENIRAAYPAFVLVPALPEGKRWRDSGKLKPSHSLSAAIEVLNYVIAQQPAIDPTRIYVIGCGMGGNGAFGAAQYYPDIFAAAVAISGEWNKEETSNMVKVPLAAFILTMIKSSCPSRRWTR